MFAALVAAVAIHVIPRPVSLRLSTACSIAPPRSVSAEIDASALDILRERWNALGVAQVATAPRAAVQFLRAPSMPPQAYRLTVTPSGVQIWSSDQDGAFYAVMTLAQLPVRDGTRWRLHCLQIMDRPALRWRILSDDVSRGPLPTMHYFKERIRTIAAFKMNGYSPYAWNMSLPRPPIRFPRGPTGSRRRSCANSMRTPNVFTLR